MLNAAKSASIIFACAFSNPVSHTFGPISAHTLSYKISGITEYHYGDKSLVKLPGMTVFMPKGSFFSTNVIDPGDYMEIKFASTIVPDPDLRLYSGYNEKEMEKAFRDAAAYYASKDDASFFNCQIQLNKIFALIANSSSNYMTGYERDLISPATEYLKAHIFEPSFSVGEMQSLVGVSDTYFRRLFIKSFHMTPQRYVVSERIQLAKSMLIDNPSTPVQRIAEVVGYTDAFYFSRIFKKETGESPAHFAKRAQVEQLSASFN